MKAQFVSLEGLSGVGKSTISRMLAETMCAELVGTIPYTFSDLRKVLDRSNMTSIHARFLFYLAAVLEGEKSIRTILQSGKNVVVESYLYRTIAFHRGMGSDIDISIPESILLPDVIFHLVCEEGERQQRRRMRQKQETYWDRLAEQNTKNILREYHRFQMKVIDTTYLEPEVVVNEIISHLKGGGQL